MKEDLIYHIVSRRKWRESFRNGKYRPVSSSGSLEGPLSIPCSASGDIEDVANRKFAGRKDLFLIVIDVHRLISPVEEFSGEEETGPGFIIRGAINGDAVLDKISLEPGSDRQFEIRIDADE